jgi:hypothetical protein
MHGANKVLNTTSGDRSNLLAKQQSIQSCNKYNNIPSIIPSFVHIICINEVQLPNPESGTRLFYWQKRQSYKKAGRGQAGEADSTTFCINLQPTEAVSVSASSNPLTGTKHNDWALHQTCSFFLAFLPGNRIMQEAAMHSLFPIDYQLHCSVDAAPRSIIVLGSFKLKPSVKCPVFICWP